ncbi:MAG: methyltransferase domain-containing protein [Isosphaeraceae bacterium]
MEITGERYFPRIGNAVFAPFEPFVSYEHWHRYCFALPFVEGKVVLDIASGEGYGSAFLAEHAELVYGVDISEEAVQHARTNYVRENLHYLHGSAESIPIPGEQCFDVIVSFETVEHLDAEAQERFAAEIRRLLRPDGVLLISTPNRDTYSPGEGQGNPYHFHEFRKGEFLTYLGRSFAHVRLLSQHVYPMSYIWNLESPSPRLDEYQIQLADGRFRPGVGDDKEIGYLIAVCSNRQERADATDSLLVDLSEVAFRGIPGSDRWQLTSLFCDTGAGYRAEEVVRSHAEYGPQFTQEFNLDPTRPVKELRWDPLESRLCTVRLKQVLWQDDNGLVSRVDLDQVTSNGRQLDPGCFEFLTLDPMIFLPIAGRVESLLITGECDVADLHGTIDGMQRAVWMREQELGQHRQDLRLICERLAAQERADEECRNLLNRELEDKVRQLREKRRELEARDQKLEDARRAIDEQARLLEQVSRDRDLATAELASALRSISWRAAAPLRVAGRLGRGLKRRARAVVAARGRLGPRRVAGAVKRRFVASLSRWTRPDPGHGIEPADPVHSATERVSR